MAVCCAALMVFASGCSGDKGKQSSGDSQADAEKLSKLLNYRIPADVGDKIKRGMTEDEIRVLMNGYGKHQFSGIHSNQQVRCVEYLPPESSHYSRGYYFVFTNSVLSFVCTPPERSFGEPYDVYGNKGEYLYSETAHKETQQYIRDILNAEDLLLREDFAKLMGPREKVDLSNQHIDWGLTCVVLVMYPFMKLSDYMAEKRDKTDYTKLTEKYNPFQFALGAKRESVESVLGVPKHVHTNALNDVYHYYWEKEGYSPPIEREHLRLALTYEDGCVTGVYTWDLFDRAVIREFFE